MAARRRRLVDVKGDPLGISAGRVFIGWCLENPTYAQLLFWRPVPAYEPASEAYQPAVELVHLTRSWFEQLRRRGLLRRSADLDAAMRDWIVLTAGVISQQLANAPDEGFESGRFTAALPSLTQMFVQHYGVGSRPARATSRRKGTARAHQG